MMNPERWRQIEGIFAATLERHPGPGGERTAFVRAACGADQTLCEEVASLLAAHDADSGLLEAPAADLIPWEYAEPADDPAEHDPLLGTRAGSWVILRRLGRGGMGTVYLGHRDDAEYRQEVAIKVLTLGLETTPLRQRFRQERQILAAPDHPALTRLIDGGVLADGRPYLVMERVDGVPLDAFCRDRDLPIRARIEIFRRVCDAVGYAHRNLVVHRDLKPGNVLVLPDGRVRLLDFGIAKLLTEDPLPDAAPPTRADWRLLTPEYASPEQLHGGVVGTAADVFALGILLYEILTGAHPFHASGRPAHVVAAAIAQVDPPRPSTRSPRHQRTLRGDLDTIVMTALRKPERERYSSVEALSEDLRRYLAGEAVRARGEGPGYRLRKFARRNWAALSAAGGVFAILVAFVVVLSRQNREIARQSMAVARERDRAEQVGSVLLEMFDASDPYNAAARADTLRVRDFLRLRQDRLLLEATRDPELEAQVTQLLGRLLGNMGLHADALPLTLRRRLLAPPHRELAESLNNLGLALLDSGIVDGADSLLQGALAMRRELYGNRGDEVAQSLNTLAVLDFRRGNLIRSEALYREGGREL